MILMKNYLVMKRTIKLTNSHLLVLLMLDLISLMSPQRINWLSIHLKELLWLNSIFLTHAKTVQLLSTYIHPHQFRFQSSQTAVSFQLLSPNQSRSSGKLNITQTLLNSKIACSSSRLFLFLHRCRLMIWTISLPKYSIPITSIFYSVCIIYHARSLKINSTHNRCNKCNRDNNSSKLKNNNKKLQPKEKHHKVQPVDKLNQVKLPHNNNSQHSNNQWLPRDGPKWLHSNKMNSKPNNNRIRKRQAQK